MAKVVTSFQLIDRMSRPLQRVNSGLSQFKSSLDSSISKGKKLDRMRIKPTVKVKDQASGTLKSIESKMLNLKGLAIGIGGTLAIGAAGNATIGAAAELEKQSISMEHFIGVNNEMWDSMKVTTEAKKYQEFLRDNANLTPFETSEVMSAGTRALGIAQGDIDEAKNLLKVAEDMAALTPGKTLSDSMEALADLNVGEAERMKEFGFKISQEDIKAAGGADKLIENDVAKYFEGGAAKLSTSASGYYSTITGSFKSSFQDMGKESLEILKPQLGEMANFMSSGGLDSFTKAGSKALAGLMTGVIKVVKVFKEHWPTIEKVFKKTKETLTKVIDGYLKPVFNETKSKFKELMAAITPKMGKMKNTFNSIIEGLKPLMPVFSTLKNIISTSLKAVVPILIDIGAKIIPPIMKILGKVFEIANWGLNTIVVPVLNLVIGILKKLWYNILSPIVDLIINLVDAVMPKLETVFKNTMTIVGDILEWVLEKVDKLIGGIGNIIGGAKKAGKWVKGLFDGKDGGDEPLTTGNLVKGSRLGLVQGSYSKGLSYVPRDGYIAETHKGERILTAQENRDYNKTKRGSFNGPLVGVVNVYNEADEDRLIKKLEALMYNEWVAGGALGNG